MVMVVTMMMSIHDGWNDALGDDIDASFLLPNTVRS